MPPEYVNLGLAKVFAHNLISFVCLRAFMLEYLSSIISASHVSSNPHNFAG